MKNIRFYEAEKYRTPDYEEVEDKIFKTHKIVSESDNYLGLRQLEDAELAEKLMQAEGWEPGTGELLEDYLLLTYEGKTYYRDSEDIGTEDDVVMVNMNDPSNPEEIFVTSIVFEAEPEYDENEPSDPMISQYPLEDILDKYFLYVNDVYIEENAGDPVNSYVEFASEDIEDIRSALEILGKHVYNFEEDGYIKLKIE